LVPAAEGATGGSAEQANAATAEGGAAAPSSAGAIGWARDLRDVPEPAKAQNIAALALHRAGDYQGSLAGFEAALALAESYPMARFNRACALSRLGRLDDAAAAMRQLFADDLTEFGPRLESDDDLAPLRDSPAGVALMREREGVVAAYAEAASRGVPVTLYDTEEVAASASTVRIPSGFRGGVYLPQAQRFVPLTPTVPNARGVVFSPEHQTITVLHGPLTSSMYELFPATFHVTVYSVARPGSLVATAQRLPGVFRRLHGAAYAANAPNEDSTDWDMSFGEVRVRPLADGVELQVRANVGGTLMRVDVRGEHPAVSTEARDGQPLHLVRAVEGVTGDSAMPTGFSLRGSALTLPERAAPIPLRGLPTFRQWQVDPQRQALFVMGTRSGCDGRSHKLLRVDLTSFEVRELSAGRVSGALLRSGAGELFVQIDGDVRRLGSDGALSDAGFPTWLKLVYPAPVSDCSM
jgi:hypothetical protein